MFELIRKKVYSILRINKKNELKYENMKICLIYLIIGFLWILFSDRITNKLVKDNDMLLSISTYTKVGYMLL